MPPKPLLRRLEFDPLREEILDLLIPTFIPIEKRGAVAAVLESVICRGVGEGMLTVSHAIAVDSQIAALNRAMKQLFALVNSGPATDSAADSPRPNSGSFREVPTGQKTR